MANPTVFIHRQELQRIQDYIAGVPHRVTGGLLLGYYFTRGADSYALITRVTTRVPERYISGEKACVDHPEVTAKDIGKALTELPDARFLGRWHMHLDGINRPSSIDMDWAIRTFNDRSLATDELLQLIVTTNEGNLNFSPFLATREKMMFAKVSWQAATQDDIDRVRYNRPVTVREEPVLPEAPLFSLKKAHELLEEERTVLQTLPLVTAATLQDDGYSITLLVDLAVSADEVRVQMVADSMYPVQPPHLQIRVNGKVHPFVPQVLQKWTSACRLSDVVEEIGAQLQNIEAQQMLPPPRVDERDPVLREIAILRTAGYTVEALPAESVGTLLVVSSELLAESGKLFCAILPASYPVEGPAWALTARGVPIDQVQFESLKDPPAHFTLLNFLEKQFPPARRQREEAGRPPPSPVALVILFYCFLFLGAGGAGYFWQVTTQGDVETAWEQIMDAVYWSLGTHAGLGLPHQSPPSNRRLRLHPDRPVMAVVVNAGKNTNLTTAEASWSVQTALRPLTVNVLEVDLQDPGGDLNRINSDMKGAQLLILYTYNASQKQVTLLNSLRPIGVPVAVVSMAPGPQEDALRSLATFYRAVAVPGGKSGARRALSDLRKDGILSISTEGK